MSLDIGPRCEQHIRATPILCIDNHIHFELLKLLIVLASLCLDNCILFVSHIRKLKFTLSKCLDLPAIEYNGNETYCFYSAHFYRFQVQSSPCLVHSIRYVAETWMMWLWLMGMVTLKLIEWQLTTTDPWSWSQDFEAEVLPRFWT